MQFSVKDAASQEKHAKQHEKTGDKIKIRQEKEGL